MRRCSGDEIKKVVAGESIDRGGAKGPAIPAAGSSIPKAKRPKAGHWWPRRGGRLAGLKRYIAPMATVAAANSATAMNANVTSAKVRMIALNRPSS